MESTQQKSATDIQTHEPVPAGWYPDGSGRRIRYWDGARWTHNVAPLNPMDALNNTSRHTTHAPHPSAA